MLSKFDYFKPETLKEALSYLDENPGTKILAGGTDLIILLSRNKLTCNNILDIKAIPEGKELSYTEDGGLFIGTSIAVNQICESNIIRENYSALAEAADSLESYQIRNRATLVGNICNASPGADLAAPLLIYDAKVHIASTEGNRVVGIDEFFLGVRQTVVKENEIVIGVSIPKVEIGDRSMYLRKSRIKGHDLCNVGLALRLTPEEKLQMAIAAVARKPLRLIEIEEAIEGKELNSELIEWISQEIKKYMEPRKGSIRSTPEYRYHIAEVLTKRGLSKFIEEGASQYV